jgi:hypothetical protein
MAGMDWLRELTSIALRATHLSSHHSSSYVKPCGLETKLKVYISQHLKENPPGIVPNRRLLVTSMDIVEANTDLAVTRPGTIA